jgi:hypothetical protein
VGGASLQDAWPHRARSTPAQGTVAPAPVLRAERRPGPRAGRGVCVGADGVDAAGASSPAHTAAPREEARGGASVGAARGVGVGGGGRDGLPRWRHRRGRSQGHNRCRPRSRACCAGWDGVARCARYWRTFPRRGDHARRRARGEWREAANCNTSRSRGGKTRGGDGEAIADGQLVKPATESIHATTHQPRRRADVQGAEDGL